MTIHLERGKPPVPRIPFVNIPPKKSAFVVPLCPPDQIGGKYVHWLINAKGAAPCFGDGLCTYCETLPRHYVYFAPVMEWYRMTAHEHGAKNFGTTGGWRKAILRVTLHMDSFMAKDHTGEVIEVARTGQYKNSPLTWCVIEKLVPERFRFELVPFDPQDTMQLVWEPYARLGDATRKVEGGAA
jgi:hypothetical protein